jgi:sugar phosphate isomerase/epimerase
MLMRVKMLKRRKISITAHWQKSERLKLNEFADKRGLGIEVTSFVAPSWYYAKNKEQLKKAVKAHIAEFSKFKNVISLHGPIMDIIPHTVDEEIRKIVLRRVTTTMKLAELLGVKRVVFHTGINPIVTAPNYYKNVCKQQAQFWDEILDRFKNQVICIENMWEPDTKILRMILKYSKSDRLKICIDVAHANVYGKIPMKEWFTKLSEHIVHLHLNDNNGEYDEHLAIGDGNLDWKTIMTEIDRLKTNPRIVIEIPEKDKIIKSLKYLRAKGYLE